MSIFRRLIQSLRGAKRQTPHDAGRAAEAPTLEVGGHVVEVSDWPLWSDGDPPPDAREFAEEMVRRLDEMRVFAARELLGLYNDGWRSDGDPVLDEREFCSRLTDPSIQIWEPGSASILFDPSGMFTDHCVEVWVEGGEPVAAEIEG